MHDLDVQLDRLADLLAKKGMNGFFANPLLTPEAKWFPDRWTPDLASVRRLLIRFADYAGLENLGIEVGLFAREREPEWLPPTLAEDRQEGGAAALFMGIVEDVAYFAVETYALHDPVRLLGILAHEMAHAWRHAMGLRSDDDRLEEQLTDLSTVVLGWGILTSNAAYQFRSSGEMRGGYTVTRWSYSRVGYLPVEVMAGLLAVHAVARGEDLREVRRHLEPTQADEFEKAVNWLATVDLDQRLSLPLEADRPFPELESARKVSVPLSRAGTVVHDVVVRLVADLGDGGGIAGSMIPFPVPPFVERNAILAMWGRADVHGGWWRRLLLVSDPEWATNALVLELARGDEVTRCALGLFTDDICAKKGKLRHGLEPLFESGSVHASSLFPALPGFVVGGAADVLGVAEIERLFMRAIARFAPDDVDAQVQWLRSFGTRVAARLLKEADSVAQTPDAGKTKDPRREWWGFVSHPEQAKAELEMLSHVVERSAGAPRP
jgi:hypothetical protein